MVAKPSWYKWTLPKKSTDKTFSLLHPGLLQLVPHKHEKIFISSQIESQKA